MSLAKPIKLSYAAYAFGLTGAGLSWFLFLADRLIYWSVDEVLPDEPWLGISRAIASGSPFLLGFSSAALLLGFILAIPRGPRTTVSASSHRAFLLRLAPIALLCVILLVLAEGRMGAFDADLVSLIIVLWFGWLLMTRWQALSRDTAVAAPFAWQFVLVIDVLALTLFTWFLCCFRMTRLF